MIGARMAGHAGVGVHIAAAPRRSAARSDSNRAFIPLGLPRLPSDSERRDQVAIQDEQT